MGKGSLLLIQICQPMKNKSRPGNGQNESLAGLNRQYKQKLEELSQLASRKCYEVDDLLDRVDRSKPVFQRMLSKVRTREANLKDEVRRGSDRATRSERMVEEYRRLHELGVGIIQKHGLLGKFSDQRTNFTDKTTVKASPLGRDVREFVTGPGSSSRINNQQEQQPPKPQIEPKPFRPETLYELLQRKLNKRSNPPEPAPVASDLRTQIHQVSESIKRQASKLKELRQSIELYRGPNSKSETRIKTKKNKEEVLPKSASVRQFLKAKQQRLWEVRADPTKK